MRTLRFEETLIIVSEIRAARVDPSYTSSGDPVDAWRTTVWLKHLDHPVCVRGNHVDVIQRAIEGDAADAKLVLVESPYKGNVVENVRYARRAMRDAFMRGEYPFASHLLYPGILDDNVPAERNLGIEAGLAWGSKAARTVVYTDRGMSDGMRWGIDRAHTLGRAVEYREIGGDA